MAEVYEEFSGSSTQDVVFAADGHSTDYVSKERGRRGLLYLYIFKMNVKIIVSSLWMIFFANKLLMMMILIYLWWKTHF
jgi:hypothetical protein